jgi:hypothetical protein
MSKIINVHRSLCNIYIILVRFEYDFNFLPVFEKSSNTNTSCIVPCGQTDMTKQMDTFHTFADMPNSDWAVHWITGISLITNR